MSSLNGRDLFGSGPHTFLVHGLGERHATHEQPGVDGATVTPLGRRPRRIEQSGTLLADSVAGLETQRDAVEAMLGERGVTLIDHLGRTWQRVVLLDLRCRPARRAGLRLALDYAADYVQERP